MWMRLGNRSRPRFAVLVTLVWAVTLVGVVAGCTSTRPLRSGLLLPGFDRQVRAQDDLFRFANGEWLRTTEIPAAGSPVRLSHRA
jgi:putative endopeptidase